MYCRAICAFLVCVASAAGEVAAEVVVTGISLQADAVAGTDTDGFLETVAGSFTANADYVDGLTEFHSASIVVEAAASDETLSLSVGVLAESVGPTTSDLFADASGSGEIEFSLAEAHFLEAIVDGAFSQLIASPGGDPIDLLATSLIPAGDYQLSAEAAATTSTEGGDGEARVESFVSITLTPVPEPATVALVAIGAWPLAARGRR